jgi:hypothetical protein
MKQFSASGNSTSSSAPLTQFVEMQRRVRDARMGRIAQESKDKKKSAAEEKNRAERRREKKGEEDEEEESLGEPDSSYDEGDDDDDDADDDENDDEDDDDTEDRMIRKEKKKKREMKKNGGHDKQKALKDAKLLREKLLKEASDAWKLPKEISNTTTHFTQKISLSIISPFVFYQTHS